LLGVALAGGALVVARLSRPAPVAAIPALPTAETKIAREAPTLRPSLPPVRPADAQSTETIPPAPGGAASGDDEASLRQRILDRARADTARAARRNVSITMYSTSWCPVCAKARSWLNGQGLAYSDLDVEKDDAAKRRARELNARGSVPTIDIDGEVLVGFSPEHAAQLVDRAAARRAGPP
jgi:glutaredoxin